ncbi:uncharacterized protein LOC133842565 [Drosophila sulfurigaster albostrigata]|uniref:uncharacterized protein LOC133842565 n=1 Tax=Drosophila sulfurigaster albostrigata TaxID=89887 RepID=UPI002D218A41|nr:uncharacterized protein LOC133842565 [Drosophila sulfurigaster albostrigata]
MDKNAYLLGVLVALAGNLVHCAVGPIWIARNVNDPLPPFAIVAGYDSNRDPIYVARASHNGEVVPAKFIPNKKLAFISWAGKEITKNDFEILTGHEHSWHPAKGGNVPPGALRTGHTADGEPLYVGRASFAGSLTPGKVHPSKGCMYVSYGGGEQCLKEYEVLAVP